MVLSENMAVSTITSAGQFPTLEKKSVIIDALFGTGLNKPLEGLYESLVRYLNECPFEKVSIDIPSGLQADGLNKDEAVITATHTLSFQSMKLCFFFAENESCLGEVHILDIGLSKTFLLEEPSGYHLIDGEMIRSMLRPRNAFAHKGQFGHAALLAGSKGMMGAATLAAGACLRSGAGKLTCYVPDCGYNIMQVSHPEAMCRISGADFLDELEGLQQFDAIGLGPGIGTHNSMTEVLRKVFSANPPATVLDADALNTLAINQSLMINIRSGTLITPHPKEFERLFGSSTDGLDMLSLAKQKAIEYQIYILLKGHYSRIITPEGKVYFNSTGNAGMAKGGSGDVLTGLITGLLAQKYPLPDAALIGAYIHGMAGDLAKVHYSGEAMQASDIIAKLGEAWKNILPASWHE